MLAVVAIYIIQNMPIWSMITKSVSPMVIQWSYWGLIVILIQYCLPKTHNVGKLSKQHHVLLWAFNIGAFFIVTNLVAGVMLGFGKSPYNHSLSGMALNALTIGIPLVGREVIRAYNVNVFCRKDQLKPFVIIVIVMTLTQISFSRWVGVTSLEQFTILCAEQILPRLCENILATYLVMYGGVKASVLYLGMITGFEWLAPILPNVDWLVKGIIGMLVPVIGTTFLIKSYFKVIHHKKVREEEKENMWTFIPTALLAILLIWFTAGLFPIYPSAIATGSMKPMIDPGDVILVEKIKDKEQLERLKAGDIIQFRRDTILITHRIVEVLDADGLKEYRTKGDNNSSEDTRLVKMEEVKGIYRNVIPKIGWPTLVFKSRKADVQGQVEF